MHARTRTQIVPSSFEGDESHLPVRQAARSQMVCECIITITAVYLTVYATLAKMDHAIVLSPTLRHAERCKGDEEVGEKGK